MNEAIVKRKGGTDFSVIVSTRNRAGFLRGCLDSIASQDFDRARFEVIAVDNGSSDGTAALLEAESRRGRFALKIVNEPEPGLSVARNRGAACAKGDVLVFLDDDAVVEPGWLAAYDAHFAAHPRAAVQGRIVPRFQGGKPMWIDDTLQLYYGLMDEGERAGPLRGNLHGGNFAVTLADFRRLGGFREDLGAGRAGLGEDSEFCMRARAAGLPVRYEPRALIRHIIPSEKATRGEALRRCYRRGFCQPLFKEYREENLPRMLGGFLRDCAVRTADAFGADDPARRMQAWCATAEHFGRVVQIVKGGRRG